MLSRTTKFTKLNVYFNRFGSAVPSNLALDEVRNVVPINDSTISIKFKNGSELKVNMF